MTAFLELLSWDRDQLPGFNSLDLFPRHIENLVSSEIQYLKKKKNAQRGVIWRIWKLSNLEIVFIV